MRLVALRLASPAEDASELRRLLAEQEARHRRDIAELRSSPVRPAAAGADATSREALLEDVRRLIKQSETRQAAAFAAGFTELEERTQAQRRVDMAKVGAARIRSGPASQGANAASIWAAIHPRLLELIESHRSTLIFVNSRRLAERLAGALNELAERPLVRAHHGSLARAQRLEIEDLLKAGHLRALVATSSLELGIDMGAIDLVIQIESPPSVASGLQRIGRAGRPATECLILPLPRSATITATGWR